MTIHNFTEDFSAMQDQAVDQLHDRDYRKFNAVTQAWKENRKQLRREYSDLSDDEIEEILESSYSLATRRN